MPARLEPRPQAFPAPGVHTDFAPSASLASPDEHGAAALIEIGLGKDERLLNAQPGAPEDGD